MITVIGGKGNQSKYVESMANYCLKKFLPRHRTVNVEIKIKRFGNDTSYGYCLQESKRDYEIEVNRNLRLRDMLTTIAHEMVHVKQYVRNEMLPNEYDIDYWDRPSEIEAHGRETGLFIRWAEQEKLGTKKWTQCP
jgi:Zn-dependent peptidase ImmA (M78 family)